jgi:hypothetical protein
MNKTFKGPVTNSVFTYNPSNKLGKSMEATKKKEEGRSYANSEYSEKGGNTEAVMFG